MRVLALNPFDTGSHRSFFEGWRAHSRHDWTLHTLPGRHWKLRMRTAALDFTRVAFEDGCQSFDVLLTTDMLPLAEFIALAPPAIGALPRVVYFHENQFTYPVPPGARPDERDLHFGFTNITTALCATEAWFNSRFNRDEFFRGVSELSRRLACRSLGHAPEAIGARARVEHPGIDPLPDRPRTRPAGPLRICWAHRWEHDKGPEILREAIRLLMEQRTPFSLDLLGQSFSRVPPSIEALLDEAGTHIGRRGYQPSRREYARALAEADVFLSTARHEFFGIACVEGVHAGCVPLLPRALAYPETLQGIEDFARVDTWHDNDPRTICARLRSCAAAIQEGGSLFRPGRTSARALCDHYTWPRRAPALDDALEQVVAGARVATSGGPRSPCGSRR